MGMLTGTNPFDRSALKFRRKAAIEYLGSTIFMDREHGADVAVRVLAATPMPAPVEAETHTIGAAKFGSEKFGNRKIEIDAT